MSRIVAEVVLTGKPSIFLGGTLQQGGKPDQRSPRNAGHAAAEYMMTCSNRSPFMSEHAASSHQVRIHIDHKPYKSLNPTTGEALYKLADIPRHRDLFRDGDGENEDELIPRDETSVHLTPDEHFYSQRDKEVTIIVNAEPKTWDKRRISYEQVTLLAFPDPPPGIIITYTVEYERGPRRRPEGSLTVGESVKVREGMIFSVTETGRS